MSDDKTNEWEGTLDDLGERRSAAAAAGPDRFDVTLRADGP